MGSGEGAVEVGEQVVDGLDADAEPDQVQGTSRSVPATDGVGHPAGVLDQRLDAAQRLPEREDLGLAADRLPAACDCQVRPLQTSPDLTPSNTWEYLEWLAGRTSLPIVPKGVMTGEDAARAIDAGAKGILVSNHGGRQLSRSLATIDALPDVVAGAAGRARSTSTVGSGPAATSWWRSRWVRARRSWAGRQRGASRSAAPMASPACWTRCARRWPTMRAVRHRRRDRVPRGIVVRGPA